MVGRQEMQELIDVFAQRSPKMIEDLIPEKLQLGDISKWSRQGAPEQLRYETRPF